MIDLDKSGFKILLNDKHIGFVFANDEDEAYEQIGDAIKKGIIETNETSVVTLVPWIKENI